MKLNDKKNLYQRFLNKELNATELEEFFQLVDSAEFDGDYLEAMPDLEVMPDLQEENNVAAAVRRPVVRLISKIAVAASLLMIAGFSYWSYRRAESIKQQSTFTIVQVPVGSMKMITLKDHSVVTLTSGSVFKYPAAFADDHRGVFLLKGKAFFRVAKDKTKPFTVFSAKLATTVLGTSFTVENYRKYGVEKIRLYTGKVQIGSRDKAFAPVLLDPGQQYMQTGLSGIKSIFASTTELQPHAEDGRLDFEATTLAEALMRVADYYNTDLHFDPRQLSSYTISGRFSNEPIEDVLHTLLFTHHLKFKKIPEGYQIMK
jgi:transmembrane sensor